MHQIALNMVGDAEFYNIKAIPNNTKPDILACIESDSHADTICAGKK